jgi:signal transduction histidine kinase
MLSCLCGRGLRAALFAVFSVSFLSCLLAASGHAHAGPQVIDRAEVFTTLAGETSPSTSEQVALPYQWDRLHPATDGQAVFRLHVAVPDLTAPLALYIPRLGNSFVIRVNGKDLASFGTLPPDPYDDSVTEPQYFVIPPQLLAADTRVEITVGTQAGRLGGLSPVIVGTEGEVRPMYRRTHLWNVEGSRFVVIVSAVLGLLAMLLWWRQRDPAYLYYGLGELLWSVQTLRALLPHSPLPWPWWGVIPLASFFCAPFLLCRFALTVMGHGRERLAQACGVFALVAPFVATFAILGHAPWMIPAWQAVILVVSISMAVIVVRGAVRSVVWEQRILGFAVAFIVACATRDVLVLRLSARAYEMVPWTRFAWVAFGVSLAWIIAERMREDRAAIARMNMSLNDQLAARNAELTAAFERERRNEKERGALEERQRLMRDLHDGLGSQLVGALRVAQQASSSREDITLQLREAVDQLKITVDAMQETDGDIPSVLGAVRYRLTPRLQAAGIDLHWDVGRLPPVPGWGVREAYQLQMLLFEAFTNMVVHSGARNASLSARVMPDAAGGPDAIEIGISDDGRGFDVQAASAGNGKGLANMRMRAQALRAGLEIRSAPGQTRIVITLWP